MDPLTLNALIAAIAAIATGVPGLILRARAARAEATNKRLTDEQTEANKRVDLILKERGELYEENKSLRANLWTEIERLKIDNDKSRNETDEWRERANDWRRKYDAELQANINLMSIDKARDAQIKRLEEEIKSLGDRLDALPPRK